MMRTTNSKGRWARALAFAIGVACFGTVLFGAGLAAAQGSSGSSTAGGSETSSPLTTGSSAAPSSSSSSVGSSNAQQLPAVDVTASSQCPVESLYDQAFDYFAEGRYALATSLLERVLRECPSHPHAGELLRRSRERAARASVAPRPPSGGERVETEALRRQKELYGPEDPADGARAQVVVGQALHGVYQGIMVCAATQCTSALALAGLGLLGGGAFGVAGYLLSPGIRPGQATAINSGSLWGLFNGLMIGLPLANRAGTSGNLIFATSQLVGGAVGTGVGTAIAIGLQPTAGHVAFATSVGMWTGVIGMLLYGSLAAAGVSGLPDGYLTALTLADAGLLAGAAIGSAYRVTAGRVGLANLGGLLGSLTGLLVGGVVASGASSSSTGVSALLVSLAVGTGAGFGITLAVTHGMDYPTPRVQASLAPVGPEGTPGMTAGVVF